jgi:hypothetical protein
MGMVTREEFEKMWKEEVEIDRAFGIGKAIRSIYLTADKGVIYADAYRVGEYFGNIPQSVVILSVRGRKVGTIAYDLIERIA